MDQEDDKRVPLSVFSKIGRWDLVTLAERTRQYTRDTYSKNSLYMHAKLEHSWEDISNSIDMALQAWNRALPVTSHHVDNVDGQLTIVGLPDTAWSVLLMGSAYYLLISSSHEQLRNEISYNDSGFSVQEYGKEVQQLSTIAPVLLAEFDKGIKDCKLSLQYDGGWGGVHHQTYLPAGRVGLSHVISQGTGYPFIETEHLGG